MIIVDLIARESSNRARLLRDFSTFPSTPSLSSFSLPPLLFFSPSRWNQDEKILSSILSPLIPVVLTLGQNLISLPAPTSSSKEVGLQLHYITKIYKTSLATSLISEMQQDSSIMPWGQFLISVASFKLDQSVTDALEGEDEEERESQEWFKAKKWATFSLNRLFTK